MARYYDWNVLIRFSSLLSCYQIKILYHLQRKLANHQLMKRYYYYLLETSDPGSFHFLGYNKQMSTRHRKNNSTTALVERLAVNSVTLRIHIAKLVIVLL